MGIVPADEAVILGVDLGKGGGVILALVPQIHLHVIGSLIAGGAAPHRGRPQLIHRDREQLGHSAHTAGSSLAHRDAARQHGILHAGLIGGLLTVDVADIVRAAAQVIQHRADHARGAVGTNLEQIACQAGGAAGHTLPQGAADAAIDQPIQQGAGGGHHAFHRTGHKVRGAGTGGVGGGRAGAGVRGGAGCGADEVGHIIQHTVPDIRIILRDQNGLLCHGLLPFLSFSVLV